MAIGFNTANILHGNNAGVWIGGEEVITATSLEAKLTIDHDPVEVLGDPATYQRFKGHSGTGTIKRYKIDSSFIKLMSDYVKSGVAPDLVIHAYVKQPMTGKVERVVFKDVTFSEVTLMQITKKELIEEEIPFNFGNFDPLETI